MSAAIPLHVEVTSEPVSAMLMEFNRELDALPSTKRVSSADAEAVYALAYQEYGRARYQEALRYFQLLLVYRPTNKVYLLGTGLCLQRLRRYDLASSAYSALRILDPLEPGHTLALAECQLLCRDHDDARETLASVIAFCQERAGHDQVLARAQAMLQLMRPHHEPLAA